MVIRVFIPVCLHWKWNMNILRKRSAGVVRAKSSKWLLTLQKKHATCCKIRTVHLQFVPVILLVTVNSFHNCANGLNFRTRSSRWMDGGQSVAINLHGNITQNFPPFVEQVLLWIKPITMLLWNFTWMNQFSVKTPGMYPVQVEGGTWKDTEEEKHWNALIISRESWIYVSLLSCWFPLWQKEKVSTCDFITLERQITAEGTVHFIHGTDALKPDVISVLCVCSINRQMSEHRWVCAAVSVRIWWLGCKGHVVQDESCGQLHALWQHQLYFWPQLPRWQVQRKNRSVHRSGSGGQRNTVA